MTRPHAAFRIGLLVCLGASGPSPALPPSAATSPGLRLVRPHTTSPDTVGVEIDVEVYRSLVRGRRAIIDAFPLPGRAAIRLDLTAIDVVLPETRFVVVDAAGEREVAPPEFRAFRGTVPGDPDGRATLSLFAGRLAGFVRAGGEEFVVAPGSFAAGAAPAVTVRARSADPDRPDSPFCKEALPTGQALPSAAALGAPPIDKNTLLSAAIAIDATYEWYAHFGTVPAAQGYILNLMAQVSTIFEDEVRVEIAVPYLRIFTSPADPYTATTNTSTLLGDLRSEWNAHQTGIQRSAAHLFSVRPSGGAGVAYVDALCTNDYFPGNSFDYAVSTLSAQSGSWEKSLVAHELGHNFSSPHTHCYSPEIDQCANESGCYQGPVVQTVGTIMSYCDLFNPVFHPRVEDEAIRPGAEAAYPTCVSAVVAEDPPLPPENLAPF